MRVGVDLDGVLYKFTQAFQTHIKKCKPHLFDGDCNQEATTWDWFMGEWGMTRKEFLAEMDCAVDACELFWEGELFEGDEPLWIQRLQDAHHTIHVVTHRFSGSMDANSEWATRFWLKRKSIYPDSLTFAKDKTCVPTDVFIEDNVENYDALEKAGVRSYLINRPYNQIENDSRRRVDSFSEFANFILCGEI